jgi:predicted TIM-barrel fold metal-dependent hydrolase
MAETFELISGGSHLDLPPERWTGRVPAKWRARVPHYVSRSDGERLVVSTSSPLYGREHTHIRVRLADGFGGDASENETPQSTLEPDARLRAQDRAGLAAEIIFTHPHLPVFLGMVASHDVEGIGTLQAHPLCSGFWRGVRDDEGYRALVRAYNSFLAEEYCAADPRRLIALGIIPDTGVDDAVDELAYCAEAGLRGVALHRFPSGRGYPTPGDDRFWREALALGMPIACYPTSPNVLLTTGERGLQTPTMPSLIDVPGNASPMLPRFGVETAVAPLQMAYSGLFDRFPDLRIYWADAHTSWLPNLLAQIDDEYKRDHHWGERVYWGGRFDGTGPMTYPPSHYLRTRCLWAYTNEPHMVRLRNAVGLTQLVWAADPDTASSTGERLQATVQRSCAGATEADRWRLLAGNAADFFHLSHALEAATFEGLGPSMVSSPGLRL